MTDPKIRIIVVDDDARLRELLNRYLSEQGYSVRAVADGNDMNRWLARERYDLMVLDLMMPGEDGLSICRRLRGLGDKHADHHADRQGRRRGPHRRPRSRRGRLSAQAVQSARARRAHPGRAAAAPPTAAARRPDHRAAGRRIRRLQLQSRHAQPRRNGEHVAADDRRIRAAEGARAASAHAALARQAACTSARARRCLTSPDGRSS